MAACNWISWVFGKLLYILTLLSQQCHVLSPALMAGFFSLRSFPNNGPLRVFIIAATEEIVFSDIQTHLKKLLCFITSPSPPPHLLFYLPSFLKLPPEHFQQLNDELFLLLMSIFHCVVAITSLYLPSFSVCISYCSFLRPLSSPLPLIPTTQAHTHSAPVAYFMSGSFIISL